MINQNFAQKKTNKKIYILSDNLIVFNALVDNLPNYFTPFTNEIIITKQTDQVAIKVGDQSIYFKQITSPDQISSNKIDILFIDKHIDNSLLPAFRFNILVNLTKITILNNEIVFTKPLMLHDLIHLILKNYHDQTIFCSINNEWIYHESSSSLKSKDHLINLTDRENILFNTLLLMKQYRCEKDYLRHNVWNYHQDSESSTVETHLYKLKGKLPNGLLEIKNSFCQLNIDSIE